MLAVKNFFLFLLVLSGESSHRKLNIIYSRRIEKKLEKFRYDKFLLLWCQFTSPRNPHEKLQKTFLLFIPNTRAAQKRRCEKGKFLVKVLKTLNNLVLVSRRLNLYRFVTSLKSHASHLPLRITERNYYCHRLPLWRLLSTTTEGVFPLICIKYPVLCVCSRKMFVPYFFFVIVATNEQSELK